MSGRWGYERKEPERLFLGFETAWAPPLAAFSERISADFPTLTFVLHYEEPGQAFAGECEWKGGKLVREEECELSPEWQNEAKRADRLLAVLTVQPSPQQYAQFP